MKICRPVSSYTIHIDIAGFLHTIRIKSLRIYSTKWKYTQFHSSNSDKHRTNHKSPRIPYKYSKMATIPRLRIKRWTKSDHASDITSYHQSLCYRWIACDQHCLALELSSYGQCQLHHIRTWSFICVIQDHTA